LPANDVPPQLLCTFEGMLEDITPQPVLHDGADLPVAPWQLMTASMVAGSSKPQHAFL
jgi:hypothetical protein